MVQYGSGNSRAIGWWRWDNTSRMCWADLASLVLLCGKKISAPGVAFGEVCDPFLKMCSAVFLAQCVIWCLHLLSNWVASSGDFVVDHSMNEPTWIAWAILRFWFWWIAKSSAFTEVTCPAGGFYWWGLESSRPTYHYYNSLPLISGWDRYRCVIIIYFRVICGIQKSDSLHQTIRAPWNNQRNKPCEIKWTPTSELTTICPEKRCPGRSASGSIVEGILHSWRKAGIWIWPLSTQDLLIYANANKVEWLMVHNTS